MGLFNLFGGKKKDEAKPQASATPAAAAPVKAKSSKPAAKTADPPAVAARVATGAAQVKLRLKLVASLRAGEHAVAYEAAKGLADIQTRAGRRTGARVWREQAERIKAQDPKAA